MHTKCVQHVYNMCTITEHISITDIVTNDINDELFFVYDIARYENIQLSLNRKPELRNLDQMQWLRLDRF